MCPLASTGAVEGTTAPQAPIWGFCGIELAEDRGIGVGDVFMGMLSMWLSRVGGTGMLEVPEGQWWVQVGASYLGSGLREWDFGGLEAQAAPRAHMWLMCCPQSWGRCFHLMTTLGWHLLAVGRDTGLAGPCSRPPDREDVLDGNVRIQGIREAAN